MSELRTPSKELTTKREKLVPKNRQISAENKYTSESLALKGIKNPQVRLETSNKEGCIGI